MSPGYTKKDLEKNKISELKAICKDLGIHNYSGLKKDVLIRSILTAQNKSFLSPKKMTPRRKSVSSKKMTPRRKSVSSKKKTPRRKSVSSKKKTPRRKSVSSKKMTPRRKSFSSKKMTPRRKSVSSKKKTPRKKINPKNPSLKKMRKSSDQTSELESMKISDLKKLMKKEGIEIPTEGSGKDQKVIKSDLISAIVEHRTMDNDMEEIKLYSKSSKDFVPKCGKKNKKCLPKACSVGTGECLPVLNSGKLYKSVEAKQKELYGEDYFFDEETKLVGKEKDVKEHINHWEESDEDARCDDKLNPILCDEDDVCSAKTGSCVKDSTSFRKGKHVLETDGRIIVGSKDTIEKLQSILGGEIFPSEEMKSKSPKMKSKSPKMKSSGSKNEKFQDKINDLLAEDEDQISNLEEKLEDLKTSRSKRSSSKKISPSLKLGATQKDIYETFSKCLSDLK